VRPEIVGLATPAALRGEVVEAAAAQGAHLFCDKPLAATAPEARRLYELADRAGVRHAYAATQPYGPSVAWLAELVRGGAIGRLREIDGTFRSAAFQSPLTPWSWADRVASGGGVLNNGLPHWLGILAAITGGGPVRVTGAALAGRERAPVVPELHDFRQLRAQTPTPEAAAHLEWRACDADVGFSALLRFAPDQVGAPAASEAQEVPVTLSANFGLAAAFPPNGLRLYGEEGTLVAEGAFSYQIFRLRGPEAEREPLPVPERLVAELRTLGADAFNKWGALARDFVAAIRGEEHRPYLTFQDGWRYQEAIDAIRAGRGWYDLPA
jgi:predicted dehydrogenase